MTIDTTDKVILSKLQQDCKQSNAEIGRHVSLSQPATHSRIQKLEAEGVIQDYVALVDREKLGYDLLCLVSVTMQTHDNETLNQVHDHIRTLPEVLECYHVTGESDLFLKVVLKDRKDLQRFIVEELQLINSVARVNTSVVLEAIKETTVIPL